MSYCCVAKEVYATFMNPSSNLIRYLQMRSVQHQLIEDNRQYAPKKNNFLLIHHEISTNNLTMTQ